MRARQRLRMDQGSENFWPSFTDMISTISIILFFLILIIFIKNIIIANDLNAKEMELIDNERALEVVRQEMALLNAEISERETNLMLLATEAEELKAEVEQGQIALKLSEEQILDQQKIIAMSNQELGDMRTKLNEVAAIRVKILKDVKDAMEAELAKSSIATDDDLVTIGDNGNIIINNTLLFGSNSSTVNEEGKVVLTELGKAFETLLKNEELIQNIDAIQIEGHTDKVNTSEYNRDLSAQRAISVVNHLLATNEELGDNYEKFFVASAYSESRPLVLGNTEKSLAQNRRIEISIILRDASIQDIIDDYLKDATDYFEE